METPLPDIPAKRYFTIGEVSELCAVKPHVLRYWEQEFTQLRPMKRRGNRRMIEAFFDLITQSLVDGNDVKISGFGNFQIRTKAARPGRNPRTGEVIPIAARRVVTFHASHKLKDLIQSENPGQSV